MMQNRPKEMDVIRRAYQLWQQAGEPDGRDDEFYLLAKQELQTILNGTGEKALDRDLVGE
jgi:hypothetical protein